MSVQQPEACYKCHPEDLRPESACRRITRSRKARWSAPTATIRTGSWSSNLKAETINLLCYKCHAEKQGPFAYPHPPVTENCAICHEPHGTVAANLLRQPPVFLCLRCHTGHFKTSSHPASLHPANINTNTSIRQALYTNCTQCHAQIHGTDVPAPSEPNPSVMFR